ncbi:uncharacterized protein SPPG_03514 [Spizellomyces punctatus DAOM BR117]|uniref:Plus3 domain-containing protein n=1 Tax=Spizellomyces punctatus (strain DAOM BR117) TaxID=645134 RepID=A0A0L0HJT0_SPIPD|nr:uncharacterized protein SPPG_03514 [Spizellomyces punctatus DAOM BR117]KND01721.1 hypothetical protein SPPG_03514 [Spizellomyces punctatus DAOM BR117]|eukprot:XP_016609760.1 hypothetical protein SPPG_03514 [Spizellomyces punctatus DAOM BR117]
MVDSKRDPSVGWSTCLRRLDTVMDEALLAIINAGQAQEKPLSRRTSESQRRSRRGGRRDSDSEEGQSGSEDDDLLSEDEEWAEVKTWDPETLMGDDADRQRLTQMSELDREAILAERKSKFERMRERLEVKRMLKRRMSGQTKSKRQQDDDGPRPSKRQTTEKAKWGDSMASLRREREKKRAGVKDEGEGRKERRRERSLSFSGSDAEEGEVKGSLDEDERATQEVDKRVRTLPTFNEVVSIQVTRSELVDWAFAPFFEKTVQGCFVRYGLGQDPKDSTRNVYRVCLIDEIRQASKTYPVDGKPVQKVALMSHAKARRENSFHKVSNGRITEAEYQRWADTMKYENAADIPIGHIQRKRDDLQRAREYVLSSEEVARIVEQKKALNKMPVNIASEITELRRRVEYAKSTANSDEEAKLQKRLEHLLSMLTSKANKPETPSRVRNGVDEKPSRSTPEVKIPLVRVNSSARLKECSVSMITNEWDAQFAFDPILDEIDIDEF